MRPGALILTLSLSCGLAWVAGGCRPQAADHGPAAGTAASGGDTPVGEASAATGQPDPSVQEKRHPLVGRWHLETVPPMPAARPSMMLVLAVDSLTGNSIHGHLVEYFAGDVGIDPATFPVFEGRLDPASAVHITIRPRETRSGFMLTGTLGIDTISLSLFAMGPDTLTPERQWRLVRLGQAGRD